MTFTAPWLLFTVSYMKHTIMEEVWLVKSGENRKGRRGGKGVIAKAAKEAKV